MLGNGLYKRLVEKIQDKVELKKLTENIYGNVYLYKLENKVHKKILLYFPYKEYMHLGDHLFFEPLAKNLKKNGYEVEISPTKQMENYFFKLGYKIKSEETNLEEYDLIITRTEFFRFLKNKKNVLMYEYINNSIREKICKDIIIKVFKVLKNEKYVLETTKPSNITVDKSKIGLEQDEKYVLFNNYLDSGKWLNKKDIYLSLEKKALEMKAKGYKIIHLGTEHEKKSDEKKYDFVDLDLRGKTTIEDLFFLSSQENVVANIGFDAFLMHLFFINDKKNYIALRNKITKNRKRVTMEFLNPPFNNEIKNKIEYLN